jgi:hypothetical protein
VFRVQSYDPSVVTVHSVAAPAYVWPTWFRAMPSPLMAMEETPLDARKRAEEQVRVVLELPDPVVALLMYALGKAGWTQSKAERVLRAEKWWLG